MTKPIDSAFFEARIAEERASAEKADDCDAALAHRDLAEVYESLLVEQDDTDPPLFLVDAQPLERAAR